MADKAIGDLPAVSTVDDNIQFPVDQSGIAMRLSISDLEAKAGGIETIEITVSGQTVTASKTAQEIYNAVVNKKKSAIVIMPIGSTSYNVSKIERVVKSGDDYTAFYYVEYPFGTTLEYAIGNYGSVTETDSYVVTQPNKNTLYTGDARLSLNYTPTSNLHAVNKLYVDETVADSIQESDVVVIKVRQGYAYRGNSAITGSQINNLATDSKAVFLFDETEGSLYSYGSANGNGSAEFVQPRQFGFFVETVSANTNETNASIYRFIPSGGELNQVVASNGSGGLKWLTIGLPTPTTAYNGYVLGVVNGSYTLVDPSTFSE